MATSIKAMFNQSEDQTSIHLQQSINNAFKNKNYLQNKNSV